MNTVTNEGKLGHLEDMGRKTNKQTVHGRDILPPPISKRDTIEQHRLV